MSLSVTGRGGALRPGPAPAGRLTTTCWGNTWRRAGGEAEDPLRPAPAGFGWGSSNKLALRESCAVPERVFDCVPELVRSTAVASGVEPSPTKADALPLRCGTTMLDSPRGDGGWPLMTSDARCGMGGSGS